MDLPIPPPPSDPVGDPPEEGEHLLVTRYDRIQKEMDEWIRQHPELETEVSLYIPERDFYDRNEKTGKTDKLEKLPPTKRQLRRAMRILYQCDKKGVDL